MMIQRLTALCVLIILPVALFAHPGDMMHEWDLEEEELRPYDAAIGEFLDERESESLDDITIGELRELGARLSVTAQEENYVRRARQSSRFMPGSGHFMIDENLRGALFTTTSVAVVAGTIVGAYFVLPDEVQFGEVGYINDSFREIGDAWHGESIASLLPAFGVLVGGALVQAILGEIASNDAEKLARRQIESGSKRFEPQPFFYPDPRGRLVLGARIGL